MSRFFSLPLFFSMGSFYIQVYIYILTEHHACQWRLSPMIIYYFSFCSLRKQTSFYPPPFFSYATAKRLRRILRILVFFLSFYSIEYKKISRTFRYDLLKINATKIDLCLHIYICEEEKKILKQKKKRKRQAWLSVDLIQVNKKKKRNST
jgi:hypothetical protein